MSDDTAKREANIARIRALMQRTVDNGCTEAEAASAARAVDRLLETYELDLDEITVKQQEIVRLDMAKVGKHCVTKAALRVAEFTDCKVWLDNYDTDLVFFGFKVDTEIAEYLIHVFQRAIDREVTNWTCFNQEYALAGSGQRTMLTSFQVGMAVRLGDRLLELKSKRDFAQRTSGRDLVAIKKPLVDEAFDLLGIHLGKGSSGGSARHAGAYNAGSKAAESVSLSQGIAGKRAAVGGRLR